MNTSRDNDAAAQYAFAVEQESQAWRALHAHEPGTPERAKAWKAWSDAIWQTNRAWRRLNTPGAVHEGGSRHAGA